MSIYNMFLGTGGSANSPSIVASGGTETIVGNYKYHTFNSSGTFTVTSVPSGRDLSYMIVAGGGGGGAINQPAGGGGAGGFQYGNLSPSVTSYTITIGGGGAASTTAASGTKGSDSSAFSVTASAGGGGGWSGAVANSNNNGASGGGGGGGDNSQVGQGTAGQGFRGTNGGSDKAGSWGGGGGGATGPAGYYQGTSESGIKLEAYGGRGTFWFTDATTGYAGGGYASDATQGNIGVPTYGSSNNGLSAAANRGAGGSGYWYFYGQAGNGGSGVVIIKYPIYGIMFNADVLIVGGGAGGGNAQTGSFSHSGGGGAGGYLAVSSHTLTSGNTYTVTIGAGQAGGTFGKASDSFFDGMYAVGGGCANGSGGPYQSWTGGSGGGVNNASPVATYVLTGLNGALFQGNKGGIGFTNGAGRNSSGGGGGASAVGAAATTSSGGNGGAGTTWVDGNTYAGGGGGSACNGPTAGTGGAGGGGNGNLNANGSNGTANTGGGGGGCGTSSGNQTARTGGNGGSGVVIIRYADTLPDAVSTTGSPTYTNTGGYKTYKFTGSGTITW